MWKLLMGLLLRLIGLFLYRKTLIYLAQRNYDDPVRHDGTFIYTSSRILRSSKHIFLPLAGFGAILGLGSIVPFGQIIGSLEGSFFLSSLITLGIMVLAWLLSLLIVTVLIWRIDVKYSPSPHFSLEIELKPFHSQTQSFLWFTIIILTILFLFVKVFIELMLLVWLKGGYGWILPLLMAALAPPMFLVHIIRYWSVELFSLKARSVEKESKKESEEEKKEEGAESGEIQWSPEDRLLAAQYFIGFFTTLPKPTHVVEEGQLENRIKGHTFLGTGPALVIAELTNIVAVRSSAEFRRFIGPGGEFISVNKIDIPYAIMDLQKQFRVTRTEAMTRDGILISVPCSSMFKIDAGNKPFELGQSWPYRDYAAFLALHAAHEVNPVGRTFLDANDARSWTELPLNTAKPKLEQLVARYTLDELYATKKAFPLTKLPRKEITEELRAYVREKMDEVGIAILGGGVGAALIPKSKKVVEQRVDTWKAGWADTLEIQEGKAAAVYLRESERVRISILNELIELAHELSETSAENKKVLLAARLLEMLENIARNPEMERLVPEQRIGNIQEEERRLLQDEPGES